MDLPFVNVLCVQAHSEAPALLMRGATAHRSFPRARSAACSTGEWSAVSGRSKRIGAFKTGAGLVMIRAVAQCGGRVSRARPSPRHGNQPWYVALKVGGLQALKSPWSVGLVDTVCSV